MRKIPNPRSGAGADDDPATSTWPYYEILNFLKDEVIPERNTGNLQDEDEETNTGTTHTGQESDISMDSSSTTSSKRKNVQDIRQDFLDLENKKLKILEQNLNKDIQESATYDMEDYHFFQSILPQMKSFTAMQKNRVRQKVIQAIMDESAVPDSSYSYPYSGYSTQQL